MPRILRFPILGGQPFVIDADGSPPPTYLPDADLQKVIAEGEFSVVFGVTLPEGAVIINTAMHPSGPSIWALCENEAEKEMRFFMVVPTGKQVPSSVMDGQHLATVTYLAKGQMKFDHIFELQPSAVKAAY